LKKNGLLDPILETCFFEVSVTVYQFTWHNTPEDMGHQQHCYENPKSCRNLYVRFKAIMVNKCNKIFLGVQL